MIYVLRIFILIMISLLGGGVLLILILSLNIAYAEIHTLNVEVNNENTHIYGTGPAGTELFLRVWDDSGELVLDGFDYKNMDGYNSIDDDGEYRMILFPKYVNDKMGNFTAEIMNEGTSTNFEFPIKTTYFEENTPSTHSEIQFYNKEKLEVKPVLSYDQLLQQNDELRQENKKLKSEIERLKGEIIQIQEDFFLVIKEQLNYFMSLTEK